MLFNVALFSTLLLVPAVLAVPSALGACPREGRRSQFNSHIEQAAGAVAVSNTQYSESWVGAALTDEDQERS